MIYEMRTLFKDSEWRNFASKGSGMVVEMQNAMLIPTDFSGMK
jgi:hypothetical protein